MPDLDLPALSTDPTKPDVWGGINSRNLTLINNDLESPRGLGAMRSWRAALGGRAAAPARIVVIGSSTVFGTGAGSLAARWTNRLGDLLHARYNPAGVPGGQHIGAGDTGWTLGGTTGTSATGLGLVSTTLAAGATMQITVTSTSATVLFVQGPGANPFTVAVDGGAGVTVTPDTTGAVRHTGTYTTPILSDGSHTYLITATGACTINGIYAHRSDEASGVQVYTSGLAGATAASFAADLTIPGRIAQLGAGHVIFLFGSNEYSTNLDPATFATDLRTIINNIRAAAYPPPTVSLARMHQRYDVTAPTYEWPAYMAVQRDLAAAYPEDLAYIDPSGSYPASTSADRWSLMASDRVHLTARGHGMLADVIAQGVSSPRLSGMRVAARTLTAPNAVSGLLAWWTAATLAGSLTDGASVSSWAPAAGTETAPLTQAGTARPVWRAAGGPGGRPRITFSAASSQHMDTGAWAASYPVPITVFAVGRFTSLAAAANLWSGRTGVFVYGGISPGAYAVGAGLAGELASREPPDNGGWHIAAHVFNGATSTIHWDSRPFTTRGTTGTGVNAALPGVRAGTNSGGTANYLTGDLCALAFYNRALTQTEVEGVMSWLADHYALEVM